MNPEQKIDANTSTMPAAEIVQGVTGENIGDCRLAIKNKFLHMLKG